MALGPRGRRLGDEVVAAGIAHATLVEVSPAGQVANLEQPKAFDDAVRSFLKQLPVADGLS